MIAVKLIKFEIKATLIVFNELEAIGQVHSIPLEVYKGNLIDLRDYAFELEQIIEKEYESKKTKG